MALYRKFLQSEVVLLCYKDIPIYVSLVKSSDLPLSYFLHEFRYTEVWDQEGNYVDHNLRLGQRAIPLPTQVQNIPHAHQVTLADC